MAVPRPQRWVSVVQVVNNRNMGQLSPLVSVRLCGVSLSRLRGISTEANKVASKDSQVLLDQTIRQLAAEVSPGASPQSWRFVCEFRPRPGAPLAPSVDSDGVGPDFESVEVLVPAQSSVQQLRLHICCQAEERNCHPEPLGILVPEKYILLYAKGEDWYELYDDCQVVRMLDIPLSRDAVGLLTAKIVVTPPATEDQRWKQQLTLAQLIGHDLDRELPNRLGELMFTRRKLASPRRVELRSRDDKLYVTEPWTTSAPLPVELRRTVAVNLQNLKQISFTTDVDLTATPHSLLNIFTKVMDDQGLECDSTSDDLVLRVVGREEFLSGDFPLSDFLWVRHCLKTNQSLHLSVVPVAQLPEEAVRLVDWPLVDSFTGQSSSHEDLHLDGKDLDDIIMISLWDCKRRFRVKLLGFDIPKLPAKLPPSAYVEASIIYGNKVLFSVASTPKAFTEEVLWNEWLEFDILLSDLLRGTKLGLTVNACSNDTNSTSKESKSQSPAGTKTPDFQQKGKGRTLYFVNLLLIDHRSILSQGPHTLHMWSNLELEEEAFAYQADKLSSATNPDISDSMAISFQLDRYSFPVVLPNGTTQSQQSTTLTQRSPSDDGGSAQTSMGHPGPVSPPLALSAQSRDTDPTSSRTVPAPVAVSPQCAKEKPFLKKFRQESVRYASNLPYFLRSIDWLKRNEVDEVHWLLGHWDPGELELSVALELLGIDFPDEQVRSLAVQRLERLSNDEVLKYLLQLVQIIKVEPYHDSFLARYLIRRALRSKRIGHFFFWYMHSEVAGCPYFRQRMAVVLEAYLLGCGQAMLDDFTRQVQAVESLHLVSHQVKELFPDKTDLPPTAPAQLQQLLEKCNLPKEFLVPFDPRRRAGEILLKKCKVMASKKKPLWLEFSSMPSPTPTPPLGIIFKQGDDLRQDMLVLQTLVVMDSIWQEKSMELNLVPYGCIATGHNIGMIEIVRNAVTIAAVQRSPGGTFEKDALYEWLKSKSPLQEVHYRVVDMFVKSCAGYCVATYVLGIGDRHNDNIMITDQGNLFHIDFGHILGNRKSFLGVSRERVPFVLTPDFLYIIGQGRDSLNVQRFKDTCIEAYLSLRSHSHLLITLFSIMLLTGIPELSAAEDMRYLREALQENRSEAKAREHFLQQISVCEQLGWTVQANWWIHLVAGIK